MTEDKKKIHIIKTVGVRKLSVICSVKEKKLRVTRIVMGKLRLTRSVTMKIYMLLGV